MASGTSLTYPDMKYLLKLCLDLMVEYSTFECNFLLRLASAPRTSRQSKYIALIRVSQQLLYKKNVSHRQVTTYS